LSGFQERSTQISLCGRYVFRQLGTIPIIFSVIIVSIIDGAGRKGNTILVYSLISSHVVQASGFIRPKIRIIIAVFFDRVRNVL